MNRFRPGRLLLPLAGVLALAAVSCTHRTVTENGRLIYDGPAPGHPARGVFWSR